MSEDFSSPVFAFKTPKKLLNTEKAKKADKVFVEEDNEQQQMGYGNGGWFWGDKKIDMQGDSSINPIPSSSLFPSSPQVQDETRPFNIGSSSPAKKGVASKKKSSPSRNTVGKAVMMNAASTENDFDAEVSRREGKALYEAEKYCDAYDAFSKCLKICSPMWSEIPSVLGNRAAALMMLDRYVEAIEDCDKAITAMPRFLRLLDRKGRAFLKLGRIDDAEKTFKELLSAYQKETDEENLKRDANVGLELVAQARHLLEKLLAWSSADHRAHLLLAEQLLVICSQFRTAQVIKMKAMCNLCLWEEAKIYAEVVISTTHPSVQQLFCSEPIFASPSAQQLQWRVSSEGLHVDLSAISGAMICMGSDMAKVYVRALKNLEVAQSYPDVAMEAMSSAIEKIGFVSSKPKWRWIEDCATTLSEYIDIKTVADEKFRSFQYLEAAGSTNSVSVQIITCCNSFIYSALYGEAINKDSEAQRWNALLYCNRSAAYLNAEKYQEAIDDCNQSLSLDPTLVLSHLRRARAHKALGSILMSIRDYRKYLSTKPRPEDADEVDEELDELLELECSDKGEAAGQLPASPSRKETIKPPASEDPSGFVKQFSEVFNCRFKNFHIFHPC